MLFQLPKRRATNLIAWFSSVRQLLVRYFATNCTKHTTASSDPTWRQLHDPFYRGETKKLNTTNILESFDTNINLEIESYLVVEPTSLKNLLVKLGSSSPNRGENKQMFELPPPSKPCSAHFCWGRGIQYTLIHSSLPQMMLWLFLRFGRP